MPGLMERLFGRGLMATPVTAMDTIATNPIGWSSMTPPQFASNASPFFNPMLEPGDMTRNQRIGAIFTAGSRDRPPLATDLPELTEAGDRFFDNAMAVAGATQPIGIRAFHGSPHTFDRFDMRKIGTGEGAQAYGHGLYFAGNEGIARHYRDALTSGADNWSVNGRRLGDLYTSGTPGARLEYEIGVAARQGRSVQEALDYVLAQRQSQLTSKRLLPENAPFLREDIATLQAMKAKPPVIENNPGSMYEVSLRTTPERLLDWDKPLSQQPRAVLEGLGIKNSERWKTPKIVDALGGVAVRADQPGSAIVPFNEPALRNAGIDGIQYLDAGSRAAGDGTRNYVLFRDDIIDILRRYGLLGLLGGGAAAGAAEQ